MYIDEDSRGHVQIMDIRPDSTADWLRAMHACAKMLRELSLSIEEMANGWRELSALISEAAEDTQEIVRELNSTMLDDTGLR